jgi:hypothetical protein
MFNEFWNVCQRCGRCAAKKCEQIVQQCCGGVWQAVKVAVFTCGCTFTVGHEAEASVYARPPQTQTHTPETASTDPANPPQGTNVSTPTTTPASPATRPVVISPPDDMPPFPGAFIQSRPPRT